MMEHFLALLNPRWRLDPPYLCGLAAPGLPNKHRRGSRLDKVQDRIAAFVDWQPLSLTHEREIFIPVVGYQRAACLDPTSIHFKG